VRLLLASSSPRRRQLIALSGWEFHVQPVEVDEQPWSGEEARGYVLRLAESKARAASKELDAGPAAADALLVAADTTVVDGGDILGKPRDAAEAAAMLRRLRGRSHQVYTALAVLRVRPGGRVSDSRMESDLCVTDVPMRAYTEQEIHTYIASGDPMDKAGAYAIQHADFHPVESLAGCYANVVGLPLCHLTRTLNKFGASSNVDVPSACQAALGYRCPVFSQVLSGEL
jgi:septum formation protein